ncbi:MAG: hypothetical protein ABIT37_06180 [Luteolibacter sp.]
MLSISGAVGAFAAPLAFPGATGFGAKASGGRGGEIYHVTNLDDSGPGSFRDAVSKGRRIVVFDVGGYIGLKSVVPVASDITIAGQTAPGEGVSTRDWEVSLSKSKNVIVRYMRFRLGLNPKQEKKYAVGMSESENIIFDHVSINWGRWDCIGMSKSDNITLQNCIVGPGIKPQRFGALIESDNVTFSHNLWISNQSRNPKSKGTVQYVNNVVYNWGVCGYVGGHSGADHNADVINNYFIAGPSSGKNFVGEFAPTDHIFQEGNLTDLDRDGKLNGRSAEKEDFGRDKEAATLLNKPLMKPEVPVPADSAVEALRKVVTGAGCSLGRDGVDLKLIADVKSLGKSGSTIDSPDAMGGFGEIKGGPAKIKTSGDAIPDDWKRKHGLSLTDPNVANSDRDNDGITNIEEYLNELAGGTAAK